MRHLKKLGRNAQYGRSIDALLYGVAHAYDFGAHLATKRGRFEQGFQGDLCALQQDWQRGISSAYAISNESEEEEAA
jgi:hypothetical protein